MEELGRVQPSEYGQNGLLPVVLVLDNVRSALNVGALFRTADSFGLEALALCGISATPPHREILKTALGSTESVAWKHFETTTEAVSFYREAGYVIVGVELAEGGQYLQDYQIDTQKKYALVLGNEVDGIDDEVMELLDDCVEIPQFGIKHSLNVSVAAGVVVWQFVLSLRK